MLDPAKTAMMNYRLERSRECLEGAVRELDAGDCKLSAAHSYYCIFHAMRSVLASESFDSKKHSGVIAAFQQHYIKTGIFPKEFSKVIDTAFKIRGRSDYQDFYVISKADTAAQIENAKTFLAAVEAYIKTL